MQPNPVPVRGAVVTERPARRVVVHIPHRHVELHVWCADGQSVAWWLHENGEVILEADVGRA